MDRALEAALDQSAGLSDSLFSRDVLDPRPDDLLANPSSADQYVAYAKTLRLDSANVVSYVWRLTLEKHTGPRNSLIWGFWPL